jgi:hypothetical protein
MWAANELLVEWEHSLGPCKRPMRNDAFAIQLDGRPISVAITSTIVSGHVAWTETSTVECDKGANNISVNVTPVRYDRTEVVELARLCSAPGCAWATRIMLRMWREVCAPRWGPWTPKVAVSYSQNAKHKGSIYRTDGWAKVREDCGSSGGGAWSRKRYAGEAHHGQKTLWVWRY